MATTRIKDLTNTATTVASDEYLAVDGTTNGTSKITRDNFRTDTAAAFVAAPGTYNLAPLSGGAVPIDKGGTAATTAAGARTSLDVPSNSEAVLVANNLSDVTAATARTNLSVNSVDEDAEANGTKLVGPALYFDGSSSYVEVADDDKLSFTDGVDDLPFSVSAWVKPDNASSLTALAKFGTTAAAREWFFGITSSGKLALQLLDTSGNYEMMASVDDISGYVGQLIHIAATYGGAGPNSASAFTAAADEITLYINGQAVSMVDSSSGTYTGMSNTSQAVWSGRNSNTYSKGHIRDVKIYNRELTATEVAQMHRSGDLGFADEWGGAFGGAYTSDFSAGVDGWSNTANLTLTGNIDSIGGQDDNLRFTVDTVSASRYGSKAAFTAGKRYRVQLDYYIPSSQSNIDGLEFWIGTASVSKEEHAATTDTWTTISAEGVPNNATLYIYPTDGGNRTFQDAGGDDVLYIRNVRVTEIGTLADFRAERYDTSTNKLYDISDKAFVGTGTSVTLTGREVPVYETGEYTPTFSFSGSATGLTYGNQYGRYTRIGNICHVTGGITLTAKGSDSGNPRITLPFSAFAEDGANSVQGGSITYASDWAALSSPLTPSIVSGSNYFLVHDWDAAGVTLVNQLNVTDTTNIRWSITYRIQ